MKRLAVALALACAIAPPALARKHKEPVVSRTRAAVAFTSAEAKDSVSVVLQDPQKDGARAGFIVYDPNGRQVYSASVALSSLDWDNPVDVWTPELARERLWLKSQTLDEMKESIVHPEESGVGVYWPIEQSEATLERAKKAGRPVLCYVTAPGGVTCAWYDDATGQGVALLEGAS